MARVVAAVDAAGSVLRDHDEIIIIKGNYARTVGWVHELFPKGRPDVVVFHWLDGRGVEYEAFTATENVVKTRIINA